MWQGGVSKKPGPPRILLKWVILVRHGWFWGTCFKVLRHMWISILQNQQLNGELSESPQFGWMISAPIWSLGRSSQPMSWYWLTPWYRCCGHIFLGKMFSLWDNLKVPSCTYRGLLVIFLINRLIYTETLPHPKISVFTRKIPLTSNVLVEMDIYFQFASQMIHMVFFF